MIHVIGIDGARGQWVAVSLRDRVFDRCWMAPTLASVLPEMPHAAAVGIDVPIGIPAGYGREADAAARAFVGARASSVFNVPPRIALEASTYTEANRISKAETGKGISRQSYALRANILEVEAAATDERVYEVHPEASFRAIKGAVLPESKKTWNGLMERIALLEAEGIVIPQRLPGVRTAADDVVDAAAAAWTADRIARGTAVSLPADPAQCTNARDFRIWY